TAGWTVSGASTLTLLSPSGGVVISDTSGGTNTLSMPLALSSAAIISNATGGTLNLTGTLNLGANTLTTLGAGSMAFSGVISGSGTIEVTGTPATVVYTVASALQGAIADPGNNIANSFTKDGGGQLNLTVASNRQGCTNFKNGVTRITVDTAWATTTTQTNQV